MVAHKDIISNLPDSILHHIFSFLDVKYVIKTYVLSKRWKVVWRSLPFLNFNYHIYFNSYYEIERAQEYMEYLYNVLALRDSSSNILSIRICYATSTTIAWINIASCKNIRVLDLTFLASGIYFSLPRCLLNCNSLVELKLCIGTEERLLKIDPECNSVVYVKLPKLVNLPRIRVLRLQSFCLEESNAFVNRLVANCPVLETLSIIGCGLCETECFSICATQLKHLEIDGLYTTCRYWERYATKNCKVVISAPMLRSFKCRDWAWNEYILNDMSSLAKAEIDMEGYQSDTDPGNKFVLHDKKEFDTINLVRGICNANMITLSSWMVKVIREAAVGFPSIIFPFLRHLKLKTRISANSIHGIKYLLEKSHHLETLLVEIPTTMEESTKLEEPWGIDICKLHNLRIVEIRNVVGCLNELNFLKLVLQSAVVLERLILPISKKHSSDMKWRIIRLIDVLRSAPKLSPSARIGIL